MPLPSLLAATTAVERPRRRAVSPVAGMVVSLGLQMPQQERINWCWAALAVAVQNFLTGAVVAQCEQANRQLARTTCCDDAAPCDLQMPLDRNLFALAGGAFTFDQVKQRVDLRRPLAAHILWSGGGSHFVCVDGYDIAGAAPRVSVKDPFYGPSTVPYDVLRSSYQSTGTWVETYFI
jgi:hypothetical protein